MTSGLDSNGSHRGAELILIRQKLTKSVKLQNWSTSRSDEFLERTLNEK